MIRLLLTLLVCASVAARASDPITAPAGGASASVSQPHVTAELIPETTTVEAGKPFGVILHLHSDPDWHTYWINPGDSGLATTINWTLPNGFTAGPLQWPTPEIHHTGTLVAYGYEGDVYLLTTITPPKADLPRHFDVKAKASWLVCKEECIPGRAELAVTLDSGTLNLRLPIENTELFAAARARIPVPNTQWAVKASYSKDGTKLMIQCDPTASAPTGSLDKVRFFAEQNNVLAADDVAPQLDSKKAGAMLFAIPLQQNGDKPTELSGVLVSDSPLNGSAKSVYVSKFSTQTVGLSESNQQVAAAVPSGGSASPTSPPLGTAAATSEGNSATAQPLLLAVLGAAFIGGLILNLMPCVLPVLSLKVFSLMKHAGEDPRGAWKQGAAFTAGVVLSFWLLAGLLIILKSFGNQLGWGFQMQSPGFVLALIFIFFLLGLNLFGVFEIGTSLVGLDAKTTGRFHGLTSSFLNGALATLAATPCTGPFMGSALGFAAQQPAYVALLVFTSLALGMAAPYLLLTIFPGALRFVPKPGAWMEAFRQFMGFLLMATVIFLVYVFGALVGEDQVPWLMAELLVVSLAMWIYGKWGVPTRSGSVRLAAFILTLALLAYAITESIGLAQAEPPKVGATSDGGQSWQPWTPAAVDAALDQGRPVFVDFTAAWCANCKVNEKFALENADVKKAFADKNVVLFQADWTRANPDIANALKQFNRDGVPLYLLYSPKNKTAPQVLPDGLITPGMVLDAVKNL